MKRPVRRLIIAAIATVGLAASSAPVSPPRVEAGHRIEHTVNREWTFNYFPAENADAMGCAAPAFDDSAWPAVALPHTWQTYETTGKIHPFIHDASERDDPYWWRGWGWYRKHFSIARSQAGRKVFVEFDGVQKYSRVYVNGRFAGDHKGGYNGFDVDITDLVRFGGDNVLAVAVNNRQNDPFSTPPMSAGNFDVYGGIYRDVRLVITDRLHIPYQGSARHEGGTFVTTPQVSATAAEVRVRTWVRNDYPTARQCELRTTIADAQGTVLRRASATKTIAAGEIAAFDQQAGTVDRPRLWSPETPYLYTVVSEVVERGTVVDRVRTPFGIRTFHWDYTSNRLVLNGRKVIIHGSNRHQEYPWLGDATPKWLHLADMRDFRENLNHNFMRTAHYPQDPAIYDFTDRRGIIVIEEAPNIKRQKFSPEVQQQQLREMIRRDRNHPSIFFWSMGNETDDAVDSKFAVEEDSTRLIHARDIYNDSAGKFVNTTSDQIALESLLRCTIRGWYNADVRNLEPESVQQTGHEEWQHDRNAQEMIARNRGRTPEDRANLNTWLYEDHGCDREYASAPLRHVNPKGFVDVWRTPKYFYYLWQANYADKLMVFIHPHFWRSQYAGQKREIVVDSNGDTVELKVNNRSLGAQTPRFEEANVVRFKEVPIERGTLTAVARRGGQTAAATVVMAGPPARLTVATTPGAFDAALDSVAIVRADIVDAGGHHVYGATNALHWEVTGPATLVGPPVYTTDTSKHEEMSGTMYIDAPAFNIIRSTGEPGVVTVRVFSPGLASAAVRVTATTPRKAAAGVIIEPPLPATRRRPLSRRVGAELAPPPPEARLAPPSPEARLAPPPPEAPLELHDVAADLSFGPQDYRGSIDAFLRDRNRTLDVDGPEYASLLAVLSRLAQNGRGTVIRDDFNFTARAYNQSRRLAQRVAGLDVPPLFKRALREHYATRLIEEGEAGDEEAETRWLTALRNGTLVVPAPSADAAPAPGVVYAARQDFVSMVALAVPGFDALDADRRAALLDQVARVNPWVARVVVRSGGEPSGATRLKTVQTVTYEMRPGRPVLVPPMTQ